MIRRRQTLLTGAGRSGDPRTTGAGSTSVRPSLMPMLQQTTGEARLADHKRRH